VIAGEAAAAYALEETRKVPTPAPADRAAAFFDVDNTIMRGAALFQLARGLHRRRFFTLADIVRWGWRQVLFRLVGENLSHLETVQAQALTFVEGHSVSEIRAIGEEVFDEFIADKIWPGTLALAIAHLEAGHQVWLVTATPVEVADVIAGRLGLTGALGTVAEHVDGVYTGRLVGQIMHGQAKAEAVRALTASENLDLAQCSAYSDSTNDIPMLSLVGTPCAINPDKALRAHARTHGWTVHDFRTGLKAARIAVPVAAAAGAGVAGAAVTRRLRA
jgi:HAD superfamily hydrolase (TIGR01490 family)